MYNMQYKWSSDLNKAIDEGDITQIEELLKDDSKDINFKGKSVRTFGRERPLEFACYFEKYEVVQMLIDHGAKVYKNYYFEVARYNDFDTYEKTRALLQTGTRPAVIAEDGEDLLCLIARTLTTTGENVYGIERAEWENKITETYKLIYYNAEPFDKATELKKSLKFAEEHKNNTLVNFIESELSTVENK